MFLPDKNLNPAPVEARKPFTPDVAGLIAWLETQDGATEYDYIDGSDCLLCRFAEAILGRAPTGWLEVLDLLPYPAVNEPCLRDAAYPYWGSIQGWDRACNYSAALSRARKVAETR